MTAAVRRPAGGVVTRRGGRVLATLATSLTLAAGTLTGLAATALPARADDAPGVELAVTAITPTVLQPGTDLQVTATVTNTGPDVAQPRVLVHLNRATYISRSSLDRWREAGPYDPMGATVAQVDLAAPLAAGASTSVTITVPATALGLGSGSSWGARGLGVELVDAADPARARLGTVRTFVVWFPPQEVNPTVVSVLVPITGPEPGADARSDVEALTAPDGRLADVVAATSATSVASWALDPWLLDTALGTGSPENESLSDEAVSDGVVPTSAGWALDVLAAAENHEVTLLPWGDADVAALVHAGRAGVLEQAVERSAERAADLGLTGTSDLVWPGTDLPDTATASAAAERGSAILVAPGELPPPSVLTYTPTGRTTLTTPRGDVDVLVPDERLSTALTIGTVIDPAAEDGSETRTATDEPAADRQPLTGATAAADLLAELAVITRERPAESRHVLITVPRTWQPTVGVARAQLVALAAAPFVQTEPVGTLVGAASPDVARGSLPDLARGDGEVSAATLDAVADAVSQREALATIVADPSQMLGDLEAERLAPAALAWRADPAGRAALVVEATARTDMLRDAVSAPPGLGLILLSTSGELPLRVANTLDQPVTVQVALRPSDSRLTAGDPVTVEIPAEGEQTVLVPVHGVLSADVRATVELLTPGGELLNDTTTLTVRVRAEWENIGTAVVSGVLGLMLVIGLVRTIRRGRRGSRAARAAARPAATPDEATPDPATPDPATPDPATPDGPARDHVSAEQELQ